MLSIPLPLAQLVLSAFNHVTGQQPLLREALRAHAGLVLRIHVLPPASASPASVRSAQGGQGTMPVAGNVRKVAPGHGTGGQGVPGTQGRQASSASPHANASAARGASTLPSLQSDARIGTDGALTVVTGHETPAVTLTVRPSVDALFRVLREGPTALGASLRIEGEVMLASVLGDIVKTLHWDVEEDLSRVVGDVAAHRVGSMWRDARSQADAAGARLRDVLGEHLSNDRGVLISRADIAQLADGIRQLDQRLSGLEAQLSQP